MAHKIHHLNCGTMCPVGQWMINYRGALAARGTLVCHCQLIETNDGLILVDTGLGTHTVEEPMEELPGRLWQALNMAQLRQEETAVHQVRELGFDPRDVRHIVLTHLDFDHAGGIADFPQAKVHVFGIEFDAAMARATPRERMRYAPAQWAHRPNWVRHDVHGDRWYGFDSVRAIDGVGPDVLLVPLLGHSRGHCGVAVSTADGWLLNCGDAAFYHGELSHPDRRVCPPGLRAYQNVFQFDRHARLTNQRRLRALAADPAAEVRMFCSHDPDMLHRFVGHGGTQAAEAAAAAQTPRRGTAEAPTSL